MKEITRSISPTAQKLFPLKGKFGVGTFGSGIVNGKSMYSHFKILGQQVDQENISKLSEIIKLLEEYFLDQLGQEAKERNIQIAEGVFPFGFKIVGHENDEQTSGEIATLEIGKTSKKENLRDFGCTVGGDPHIVQKLWSKLMTGTGEIPIPQPAFNLLTLQDALDYSDFLIRTTADYQRFANMIPTVGGPIDIGLVTNHSGFKWIRQKKLSEILD